MIREFQPPAKNSPNIKERFLTEVGIWPAAFEHLVRLDPEFVEACLEFSVIPRRHGALDPKVRDFVHVALEIAVTHMHPERARAHIASAFGHGATVSELVDVCELVTLLGVHAMTMAAPILAEELAAAGQPVPAGLTAEQADLRERYVADRGTFPPPLKPVLTCEQGIHGTELGMRLVAEEHARLTSAVAGENS